MIELKVKVTRGCLLKLTPSGAILHISGYCPEEMMHDIIAKAQFIISKLGTTTEALQGVFYKSDHIVMENFSKTKRTSFIWEKGVPIISSLKALRGRGEKVCQKLISTK